MQGAGGAGGTPAGSASGPGGSSGAGGEGTDYEELAEQALGLPVTEHPEDDTAGPLEAIRMAIERRFGANAKVLWLATMKHVGWYCERGETPDVYRIPRDALIITDLGEEGQLFLMTDKDYEDITTPDTTPIPKVTAKIFIHCL